MALYFPPLTLEGGLKISGGSLAGGTLLKTQFPRLFLASDQSTSTVREMSSWVEGHWLWDLKWRRDFFVWELNLLERLHEILDGSTISTSDDSWCWKHQINGIH
ncbi:hypothetical protein A2U01_0031406 [Trifolium medium]|uniref:Uncharacterized protein n=1 Tax=Trifolium medium TaxID=97028 RepID=A0A392PDY0_9FABA|nr:hypothetical protein [Trifolium medium]